MTIPKRGLQMKAAHSIALFLTAGLCEIGGGYLVWQRWRNGAPWFVGASGVLILYLGSL
jgi:small multidrug resistance family-3 protein